MNISEITDTLCGYNEWHEYVKFEGMIYLPYILQCNQLGYETYQYTY
jgi:hypothetical protein